MRTILSCIESTSMIYQHLRNVYICGTLLTEYNYFEYDWYLHFIVMFFLNIYVCQYELLFIFANDCVQLQYLCILCFVFCNLQFSYDIYLILNNNCQIYIQTDNHHIYHIAQQMSNKTLFEQQDPFQTNSSIILNSNPNTNSNANANANKNIQKKPRPKFTILDDLDQLNQIINGPGANQQSQKTQEMLQKTYQYMRSHQQNQSNAKTNTNGNVIGSDMGSKSRVQEGNKNMKKSNVQVKGKLDTQHMPNVQHLQNVQFDMKENTDGSNISDSDVVRKLEEQLRGVRGPRIVVTIKKVNLLKEPMEQEFYVTGLENLGCPEGLYGQTRAPRNSFQDSDCQLFSRALQTQRFNKNNQHSRVAVKK